MKNIINDINNNHSSLINRYQINLVGDTTSGKTTFIKRIFEKGYNPNIMSTLGPSFFAINRKVNDYLISFDVWDSRRWGDGHDSINKIFLGGTNGIFLLFSLKYKSSFHTIEYCYDIIKEINLDFLHIPILLIGTHEDLITERQTESQQAIQFSKNKNFVGYFEVSSLNGKNVEESFDFMVNCIYQINILNKDINDIEFTIKL